MLIHHRKKLLQSYKREELSKR